MKNLGQKIGVWDKKKGTAYILIHELRNDHFNQKIFRKHTSGLGLRTVSFQIPNFLQQLHISIENFIFSSKMANSRTLWFKKTEPHL